MENNSNKLKVLITGGSGLIGNRLSELLVSKNIEVVHLSRKPKAASKYISYQWNPETNFIDTVALNGVTHIINLAGSSIAGKRWTISYKNEILQSRLNAARTILNATKNNSTSVEKIISASAIGFYGDNGNEWCMEEKTVGKGFLATTTQQWENAFAESTIPTTLFRIGVVLSKAGGALPKLIAPFKFGIVPVLGDGKQWISWIDLDDLCELFLLAITNSDFTGIFNAVAPNPVTNEILIGELKNKLNSSGLKLHVPEFLLRLILGEKSCIVLDSTKVSCEKLIKYGYQFRYDTLEKSLSHIYG